MKIVHLIFAFNTGGSETMMVDIVNEQCKFNEVSIIIINNKYNQSLIKKIDPRVIIYFINRSEGSRNLFKFIKLNTLLFSIKSDVVHCHNHNIIPLLLPFFWKKAFLTLHSLNIPVSFLIKYKKLFSISEAVRYELLKRSGINSIVIYNGIKTDDVNFKNDFEYLSTFKIVQVSRLQHFTKGQHIAVEALKILKNKGINNIHLDFIGEGESEQLLKELVSNYTLESQIHFLGNKSRDFIYTKLKDYDLLIQPSIYEGFGLTVAEGMAAKLPVLVSDVDGPMEVIENGKCGYYFESGNPVKLAERIEEIKENYQTSKMKEDIERAYNRVISEFDIKRTAENYMKSYQN